MFCLVLGGVLEGPSSERTLFRWIVMLSVKKGKVQDTTPVTLSYRLPMKETCRIPSGSHSI